MQPLSVVYLLEAAGGSESTLAAIRRSSHSGRPLATEGFVQELEKTMQRSLTSKKGGRPAKSNGRQQALPCGTEF